MPRSIAIATASTAKGFLRRRHLLERGNFDNPEAASHSFCVIWSRPFSGATHYRERLRNGFLRSIKFDDAFNLFCEMLRSRPLPSIVDFTRVLTAIAKMNKYDIVIYLCQKMEN
ncbi:unnamed protein product [Microthlaspi erraticum]|uniref:Pentatricopeptide repeat-containing protein n=1 Tax=Microthlaspi erraticum TaxID=1685480 RepID=A0A6D2L913_9BRAS|nr:unnamed protein product [Microthlaspi erraticum]CAA7056066.1 unnamed protein product [Microthlaspi erraticum]